VRCTWGETGDRLAKEKARERAIQAGRQSDLVET
jgi:hypothetical protein